VPTIAVRTRLSGGTTVGARSRAARFLPTLQPASASALHPAMRLDRQRVKGRRVPRQVA